MKALCIDSFWQVVSHKLTIWAFEFIVLCHSFMNYDVFLIGLAQLHLWPCMTGWRYVLLISFSMPIQITGVWNGAQSSAIHYSFLLSSSSMCMRMLSPRAWHDGKELGICTVSLKFESVHAFLVKPRLFSLTWAYKVRFPWSGFPCIQKIKRMLCTEQCNISSL